MNVLQMLRKDVDESREIGSNIEAVFLDDLAHLVYVAESVVTLLKDDAAHADCEFGWQQGIDLSWRQAVKKRIFQLSAAMKPLLEEVN